MNLYNADSEHTVIHDDDDSDGNLKVGSVGRTPLASWTPDAGGKDKLPRPGSPSLSADWL